MGLLGDKPACAWRHQHRHTWLCRSSVRAVGLAEASWVAGVLWVRNGRQQVSEIGTSASHAAAETGSVGRRLERMVDGLAEGRGSCDGSAVGDGIGVKDFASAYVADEGVIENDVAVVTDFASACVADEGVIGYENDVAVVTYFVAALAAEVGDYRVIERVEEGLAVPALLTADFGTARERATANGLSTAALAEGNETI